MEDSQYQKLDKKMDDMMDFLVERMATKDDIARLDAKIDRTHNDLMQEIRAIRSDIDGVKRDIARLEKRMGEDLNIYASDILELRSRVKVLERQIKELQPAS